MQAAMATGVGAVARHVAPEARKVIDAVEVNLNVLPVVIAAVEEGELFERSILNIDEKEYIENLKTAILNAKKLAIGANILTAETAPIKLQEAHMNAKKLAFGADILCDETKEYLIKKAEAQASALNKAVPETLKETVTEESQSTEDTTEQSSAEPEGTPEEVIESEEIPAKEETPKAEENNNPEGEQ